MSGKVDHNYIPLHNSVVEFEGLDFFYDRIPCSFAIAEVPDLRTRYAQLLQVISHSIRIGYWALEVLDFKRFIFADSNNQREEMQR